MKIFCLIQFLIMLISQGTSAQWHNKRRTGSIAPWELGLSAGISSFVTTVNPESGAPNAQINYWNREINPGIGLSVLRNISPSIGIEMNWLNTRLSGSWNNKWPPLSVYAGHESPLPFKSQINQFDLMMTFNVNQIMLPGEDQWHLFFKTGIGVTNIKNFDKYATGNAAVLSRISFAVDAGFSVTLNKKIKLLAGNTIRSVSTDNLDEVHIVSVDAEGELVHWMKVFEIYNYAYLRLSYCLGDFGSKKSKNSLRKRVRNMGCTGKN